MHSPEHCAPCAFYILTLTWGADSIRIRNFDWVPMVTCCHCWEPGDEPMYETIGLSELFPAKFHRRHIYQSPSHVGRRCMCIMCAFMLCNPAQSYPLDNIIYSYSASALSTRGNFLAQKVLAVARGSPWRLTARRTARAWKSTLKAGPHLVQTCLSVVLVRAPPLAACTHACHKRIAQRGWAPPGVHF